MGLKFSLPSDIYDASQLSTRKILTTSENEDIKGLYNLTKAKHLKHDDVLRNSTNNNNPPKKQLRMNNIEGILNDLNQLKEQNTIIKTISELCSATFLIKWQKLCETLPANIFIFIRKALIFNLPVNTNLYR